MNIIVHVQVEDLVQIAVGERRGDLELDEVKKVKNVKLTPPPRLNSRKSPDFHGKIDMEMGKHTISSILAQDYDTGSSGRCSGHLVTVDEFDDEKGDHDTLQMTTVLTIGCQPGQL